MPELEKRFVRWGFHPFAGILHFRPWNALYTVRAPWCTVLPSERLDMSRPLIRFAGWRLFRRTV